MTKNLSENQIWLCWEFGRLVFSHPLYLKTKKLLQVDIVLHGIIVCTGGICSTPQHCIWGLSVQILTKNKFETAHVCVYKYVCNNKSLMVSYQFLQVVGGRFSDGVDVIDEPGHAEAVQLLVEEVDSKLS